MHEVRFKRQCWGLCWIDSQTLQPATAQKLNNEQNLTNCIKFDPILDKYEDICSLRVKDMQNTTIL